MQYLAMGLYPDQATRWHALVTAPKGAGRGIDHALIVCGGDNYKTIALVRLQPRIDLGKRTEEHRTPTLQKDEGGLLLLRLNALFFIGQKSIFF